jgi:hypothetical protein
MKLQEQAKAKSERYLEAKGVAVNTALPLIESPDELRPRSAADVARRSLVLGYMIGVGFGQPGAKQKAELVKWQLYGDASPEEQSLLEKSNYDDQEKVDATWLTECVQSLAWGLRMATLDHFRRCDDDLGPKFPIMRDPSAFVDAAKLRSFQEIYFEADLLYRLHWAARNARLLGQPSSVMEGRIAERRKAVDWMIGVAPEWDEIPLDT